MIGDDWDCVGLVLPLSEFEVAVRGDTRPILFFRN